VIRTIEQKLFRKASETITKNRSFTLNKQNGSFCFIFEIPKPQHYRPDNYPIEGIFSIFLARKDEKENYTGLKSHLYEFRITQLDAGGQVLKNICSGFSSGHSGGRVETSSSVTTETLDNFWDKICGLRFQKRLRKRLGPN